MLHLKKVFILILSGFPYFKPLFAQEDLSIQLHKFSNDLIAYVTSISKDNKNFIWISTQQGVFRFDSKSFIKPEVIDKTTGKKDWSAIRKVCYNNKNDELIILSPDKGLAILNRYGPNDYFELLELPENLKPTDISNIDQINDKYVLSTLSGLHFVEINSTPDKKNHILKIDKFLPLVSPTLMSRIHGNKLMIIDQKRDLTLFDIDKDHSTKASFKIPLSSDLPNTTEIFSLDFKKNSFFIGTSSGLVVIAEKNDSITKQRFLTDQAIYSLEHSVNGICWVAASNGLFKLNDQLHLTQIKNNNTNQNDDWLKTVYSIYADNKQNLWIGTQNGLAMLQDSASEFFSIINTNEENKMLNHVYHLGVKNNGNLLISSENGLYEFVDNKKVKTLIEGNTFFLNFIGPDGNTFVSDLASTYILKNDKLINYSIPFPEFNLYKSLSFNDYSYYQDSLLFLSTENTQGVIVWNYKRKTVSPLYSDNGKKIEQTNRLYRVNDTLFVLTDSTLFVYNITNRALRKQIIHDDRAKLNYGLFFDMLKIGDYYYLSSYGNGVIITDTLFKVQKILNESNGLSNNGVYRILSLGDTTLYISTNHGINVFNLKSGKILNLYAEDGLHGNSFEEFSSLKFNDKLYFGGKGGVTSIDPLKTNNKSSNSNLTFLDYKIVSKNNNLYDETLLEKEILTVPNTTIQLTINFQNIIYPYSSKTKYAYQIKEFHKNWINIGSQNFVSLVGLSPGTYHLQVQAFNEDGVPSEIKKLTLIFRPKWYQTWWFKVLIALAIASAFYGLYRFRINHLKKEENIRKQVAGDLHDELGSTLNSVKIFTNLALMEKENTSHLEKIKEATQSAIAGVKDIIWVLDDKRDTLDHLLGRINQFARPICEAAGISYNQQSGGNENYKLRKEEKRNLYMIIKESINNSIKYADCSVIEVLIKNNGGKINISISDNGKGFDKNEIVSGYGLKNIMRRSEEINYHAEINSSPGNGTLIYLEKK